jgi:tetratricopeptide (TPR) repeat protein
VALSDQGRYSEAIDCYDEARSLYPFYVGTWRNKAIALAALNRDDEAAEANTYADLLDSTGQYPPLPPERYISMKTTLEVKERPSGPYGQAFYNVSSYSEVNESYSFFKQYYDLDLQLKPLVEERNGTRYLVGVFRNNTSEIRFETLGGFFMPAYRPEMRGKEVVAFDCSEIAALTEYYLERAGIPAKIALTWNLTNASGKIVASTGIARPGSNFTHAFVLLDLPGGPYYIDPSRPDFNRSAKLMLIGPGDPDYDKPYYDYEHLYENIYDLINESHSDPKGWLLDQFDWWNSGFFVRDQERAGMA